MTNEATGTISVFSNTPGLCNVQYVKGQKLASASRVWPRQAAAWAGSTVRTRESSAVS